MKGKNACPKCGKAVYFAEETIAIGKKWHKMCLKCGGYKTITLLMRYEEAQADGSGGREADSNAGGGAGGEAQAERRRQMVAQAERRWRRRRGGGADGEAQAERRRQAVVQVEWRRGRLCDARRRITDH